MNITCDCGHKIQYSEKDIFSHKVLCGDSTSVDDVEKLMDGKKADMVFTSPPYSNQRAYKIGSFDWDELMNGVFTTMMFVVKDTTHILVNLGIVHKDRKVSIYWDNWLKLMNDLEYPLFGWYTWDKTYGLPGEWNGRLAPAFEFIFHFNKKCKTANKWVKTKSTSAVKNKNKNSGMRNADGTIRPWASPDKTGQEFKVPDSVIRICSASVSGLLSGHPAVYPVALPEFGCKTWTQENDIVYEPFAGSGTTVIACDKTKRQCRAIEISEDYVDIVIARYVKFVGNKGMRLNSKHYDWVEKDEKN